VGSIELKNIHMSPEDFHNAVKRYTTDCNKCIHINLTEKQQGQNKAPHICNLFNKRCLHQGFHPAIIPCIECNSDSFVDKYKE